MEGRNWHSGRTRNCPKGHFSSPVCCNCEPAWRLSDCRRSCLAPSLETPVLCLSYTCPQTPSVCLLDDLGLSDAKDRNPRWLFLVTQRTDFMVLLPLAVRLKPTAWYRWEVGRGEESIQRLNVQFMHGRGLLHLGEELLARQCGIWGPASAMNAHWKGHFKSVVIKVKHTN